MDGHLTDYLVRRSRASWPAPSHQQHPTRKALRWDGPRCRWSCSASRVTSQAGVRAAGGPTLRDMNAADIPAVHELERRLFPVDAWPLQMFFDGPAIHTQRSVFQIDPPKVAPID